MLLCHPVAGAQGKVDAAEAQTRLVEAPGRDHSSKKGLERLDDLNLLSAGLVDRAGSGSAPAHQFRLEARMYRELLRQVMLDNRGRAGRERFPQPMLLDMVRMSALLHAAADCKTGRVIVCPADLMQQLRSQQARVSNGLEMLRMMHR